MRLIGWVLLLAVVVCRPLIAGGRGTRPDGDGSQEARTRKSSEGRGSEPAAGNRGPNTASPAGTGTYGVALSHPRPAQGSAILVQLARPAKAASFAGKAVHPYPTATGQAILVGVDLELKPGDYELVLTGDAGEQKVLIPVVAGKFRVQKLTVPEKMVHPDPASLARIEREQAELEKIFAQVTPRLIGGTFVRPVPGAETAAFGGRRVFNGVPKSPHSGTDLRAATGTPIKAPAAGKVVLVADHYFTGNTVVLDHGLGVFTQYAHLSAFTVLEDTVVKPGDIIGKVGATGRVTGPHLHWGAKISGARVNPMDLTKLKL